MGKQGKKHIGFLIADVLDMLNGSIQKVGAIEFDITNGTPSGEGILHWNSDDGTLEVGMPGGNVNLQMGQEQIFLAKNISGDVMPNGTAVIITGASGVRPEIDTATTTPQTTSGAVGLTTEEIANNQQGYVTTLGLVRDIDTSAFSAGSRVFLSDTPGELSATLPAVANRKVFMGIVIRAHATEGVVWCAPLSLLYLNELSGSNISNPQDGDVLTYHAASGAWINQALP
jgi:hypothetical protein